MTIDVFFPQEIENTQDFAAMRIRENKVGENALTFNHKRRLRFLGFFITYQYISDHKQ